MLEYCQAQGFVNPLKSAYGFQPYTSSVSKGSWSAVHFLTINVAINCVYMHVFTSQSCQVKCRHFGYQWEEKCGFKCPPA